MTLQIRRTAAGDAETVAQLHAKSWQSTYRRILRDAYLAGPVLDEHREYWTRRLAQPLDDDIGLLAESKGKVVGFLFAVASHHPRWGTYLENLHVSPSCRGQGIGSRLLLALSETLLGHREGDGLYLWAIEDNHRTRAYYASLGAVALERAENEAPGGGQVAEWLYWWEQIETLRNAVTV